MDGIVAIDIAATGSAAAALVAHASESTRTRLTAVFAEYARQHGELERGLGITPHDPACAIATFIAGALRASQIDVPYEAFRGLRTQLQQGLADHPDLAAVLHLDRSTVIEQYEILGTWLTGHSGELEANNRPLMRAIAKRNVERYLGLDIADVEVTRAGLRWTRGTASGPLAVLVAGAPPGAQRNAGVSPAGAAPASPIEANRPWVYQSTSHGYRLTLPSEHWRQPDGKPRGSDAFFVHEKPVMHASVMRVMHERTADDLAKAAERARRLLKRPAAKIQNATNAAGNHYHYFTALDAGTAGEQVFVGNSYTWNPRTRVLVVVLFEGLPKAKSEADRAAELAMFEKASDTICLSVD